MKSFIEQVIELENGTAVCDEDGHVFTDSNPLCQCGAMTQDELWDNSWRPDYTYDDCVVQLSPAALGVKLRE